ncbi:MAG: hypothetical protein PHX21_13535 [bacterium]|nr:hypothetical protein [bacterium]
MSEVYFEGDEELPSIGVYSKFQGIAGRHIQLSSNKDENIIQFPVSRLPEFIVGLEKALKQEGK